ncbi:MAG: zinc ribbon domain-containing protein [Acidobacteriota bacterium]|nr:MAG: zinc ribbon domain-containing protein [Acidobacteriota bacterium]
MFCPKCGTENPEEGKFCRKCGTDLSGVSRAIGNETHTGLDLMGVGYGDEINTGADGSSSGSWSGSCATENSGNPDDLFAAGVKNAILGVGFLIISAVLFFTNVAGGQTWWWAMLFPGFALLAGGIGSISKAKRLERRLASGSMAGGSVLTPKPSNRKLREARTDFVSPAGSREYETGDLVPPSVVEGTTKHLKMDSEGETMTLPDLDRRD